MTARLKRSIKQLLNVETHEVQKVLLLTITFFLLIGAYTVTRELKDMVFATVVGSDKWLFALAKIFSMLVLIPAIFFHSRLVDLVRRHNLLYFYSILFTGLGFVFVYFMGDPLIGLSNNLSSPTRLFGWLFYFFIEAYSPLVVSVFWAFSNSITKPQAAKNNYPVMIAGSKLGGIICAGIGWAILVAGPWSDTVNIQVLLGYSTVVLGLVPFAIYYLIENVPKSEMHGYEAGYQVRKEAKKRHIDEKRSTFQSMFSGLALLFQFPYVMGIFGMTFFFEMVIQALKVENIIFVKNVSENNLSLFASVLLSQAILVHVVAFVVVLFGTRAIITYFGERRSLMVIPAVTGLSVIVFLVRPSYATAIFAFVVTRSINYAFAAPLRESLYIPTVKEIQFKSKSWIDGFGSKFAKTCAQSFNWGTNDLMGSTLLMAQTSYFGVVVFFWFLASYALGWRFETAVANNEVIGATDLEHEVGTDDLTHFATEFIPVKEESKSSKDSKNFKKSSHSSSNRVL
jgi:ATP/ADP translocase